MTIALVANSSWNLYNFRFTLIKELKAKGHRVLTIAPEDAFSIYLKEETTYYPIALSAKNTSLFSNVLLLFRFYRLYKKTAPDCVLQYTIKPNIFGTLAARFLSIPSINNVSGLGTVFLHNNLASLIARCLYRITFLFPYKVLFQNKDDQALFIRKKLVKPEKTDVVPGSGIDLVAFNKTFPGKENEAFTFLMASRLLIDKGIVEFAEAAHLIKGKYPQTRFLLAGEKEKNPQLGLKDTLLKKWEKENILNYMGFIRDIKEVISRAHCIVLPSYREGIPKSLLEAAAMGKPLIATNVPGCKEVVEDEKNGFLCKVKDAQDLAEKMEKMMHLPEEKRFAYGRHSRKIAEEKFDQQLVFAKYLMLLSEIEKP